MLHLKFITSLSLDAWADFQFCRVSEKSVKPERFNEYVDGIGRYLVLPIFIRVDRQQTWAATDPRPLYLRSLVIPQINSFGASGAPPLALNPITLWMHNSLWQRKRRRVVGKDPRSFSFVDIAPGVLSACEGNHIRF